MVTKKQIELRILKDGSVEMNVLNAEGAECLALTKDLEKSIGKTINREMKTEFYNAEKNLQGVGE